MGRVSLYQNRLREHPLYQQMLENRRQAAEEEMRARQRTVVVCILSFVFWTVLTVLITAWGMGTVAYARHSATIIEAGLLLGGAGILGTLLFAYQRLGR